MPTHPASPNCSARTRIPDSGDPDAFETLTSNLASDSPRTNAARPSGRMWSVGILHGVMETRLTAPLNGLWS